MLIGRGAVKLKTWLHNQLAGLEQIILIIRLGTLLLPNCQMAVSLLLFKHLDLRPANGADLTIVISNVNLPLTGKYIFKATYTTSQPEVLTSAESETTLTVTQQLLTWKE
jgi:hypothetical protein